MSLAVAAVGGVLVVALFLFVGPLSQPQAYHGFADRRTFFGVPNAFDVLSNLPFALLATWGVRETSLAARTDPPCFVSSTERTSYVLFFVGAWLTTFGSAWYHWAPDTERLFWDRLPMTVAFTALLVALVAQRVSVPLARVLLVPLLLFGLGSVLYWRFTERAGHGDLRPYGLVQYGSAAAAVAIVATRRGVHDDGAWWFGAFAAYALAKVLEASDRAVFRFTHVVSGHTLKHLAASGAVAFVAAAIRRRRTRGAA